MPMKGQFDGRGQWDGGPRTLVAAQPSTVISSPTRPRGRAPESTWTGHVYNLSGYAKMTRELLFRVSNTVRVSLVQGIVCEVPNHVDALTRARIDAYRSIIVSPDAPFVMIHTPLMEKRKNNICYTMMETQKIHPEFIRRINNYYDEVWLPTQWNLDVARDSGLKVPGRVMNIGVNSAIFRPMERQPLPPCTLLTTKRSKVCEVPKGFIFVFCGFPTFRKGMDTLLSAFEAAFKNDPDVSLVLMTTYARISRLNYDPWKGGPEPVDRKAKVYELTGMFTDHELAEVYNGCDCYVCASRGEGWDMPATESASCGLPLIAPLAYSHHEFMDDKVAFAFRPDGYKTVENSANISQRYEGMPLAYFGKKAHDDLVDLMRYVKKNPVKARERGGLLMNRLHTSFSWEIAADRVTRRLLEVQP
jgi:glycosyltransferase involved in cell wall biosynthesis